MTTIHNTCRSDAKASASSWWLREAIYSSLTTAKVTWLAAKTHQEDRRFLDTIKDMACLQRPREEC